ncbi:LTA synthase family protein [Chelatococcus sambhunathii]|uniref:LTA synthase family protein n=1 Tax=Chelatococcus sambhunathii TaxID=363953 RepID=A0ABU1DFZ8_9HYPH|nr:LTA synthase family protein [Chelatococcus sambhunathii]MDR4307035.1 LTA synthase family protein [Chelatococcus sambhunathii]
MIALAVAFTLSFVLSLALESQPPRLSTLRAPARALALRLLVHVVIFAAAFSLSWRPWHAALVTCVVAFLFGAGSAMKARILGEPVVFSDFALVKLAIRHPRLYYAEKLAEPKALAVFAALALATAAWFAVEPSILPAGGWPLLLAPPLVTALAVLALRSRWAASLARPLLGEQPNLDHEIDRFGLGATMTLHWLAWRSDLRPSIAATRAMAEARPIGALAPDVVVAIQCESFTDVAARGAPGPDLPNYRRLCDESLAWGRCRVPAEGAYTMRAEFGFLTGLPSEALGFDAFDPYLVSPAYAAASLGRRFKDAGRRTVLMHPYDRRFFSRDELAPQLGFDRFVDGEAFAPSDRFGPYVGDAAVAEAIAAEVAQANEPLFLFVVTIENHGPWGPGRLPGVDRGEDQYGIHLSNSDGMMGRVADALRARPGGGMLCLYGDHAPARTLHPTLSERRAADYVLWDSRRSGAPSRLDLDVDAVSRLLVERTHR